MIDKNKGRKVKNLVKITIFLLLCIFFVPVIGTRAEAAVTCKSVISYPGTTVSKVNMRKKAGTNYKSYGMLEENESVTILGYITNKGITWYKCKGKVNGKTRTGYVHSSYIIKKSKPAGKVNNKVVTYLNVRKSAKTSSKSLLKIPRNTKVNILSIKKKSGKYWYKVKTTYKKKTKTGYVLGNYITVDNKVSAASGNNSQNKKYGYVNDKVTTYLNVRKYANTSSAALLRIPRRTPVTILGTEGDWYKITVTYNGKTVTGYAAKEYITIGEIASGDDSNNAPVQDPNADADFETLLANFPESYKSGLRALHAAYPNWRFVAVHTNLDWAAAITNESVVDDSCRCIQLVNG